MSEEHNEVETETEAHPDTLRPPVLQHFTQVLQHEPEFRGPFEAQVALLVALGKARASVEAITKDTAGQSGHQTFKYATFAALSNAIAGPLAANGLGFTQTFTCGKTDPESEMMLLTTIIAGHGAMMVVRQWWPTKLGCPNSSDGKPRSVKDLGGLKTYYRRYALQAVMGIEGDRDEDQNPNPVGFSGKPPPAQGRGRPPAQQSAKQPPKQRAQQAQAKLPQPKAEQQAPHKSQPKSEPPEAPQEDFPSNAELQEEEQAGEQTEEARPDPESDPDLQPMTSEQKALIGRLYGLWGQDESRVDLKPEEIKSMFQRYVFNMTKVAPAELTITHADTVIAHLERDTEQV